MSFGFFNDRHMGEIDNPFNDIHIACVLRACSEAWGKIETFASPNLDPFKPEFYAQEEELNKRMVEILNYLLDIDDNEWFSSSDWATIVWDAKTIGADRKDVVRPDIAFRLNSFGSLHIWRNDCALFMECKVIDDNRRDSAYYVRSGILRFAHSKYAPNMPVGLMLAYAIGKRKIPDDLQQYFLKTNRKRVNDLAPKNGVNPYKIKDCPEVFLTTHNRKFAQGRVSSEVNILHLWVSPK